MITIHHTKHSVTCTRRLEWDMGHTLYQHESKCAHLHGHRYAAELEFEAQQLDTVGRVVDFGDIKTKVGTWIDDNWDHKFMVNSADPRSMILHASDHDSVVLVSTNPTAENIVQWLAAKAIELMPSELRLTRIRLWETPNGSVTWTAL